MPTLRIFKYMFGITDSIVIPMPEGARVLDVQIQHGAPCIWALVDTSKPNVNRMFRLAGTGHPIKPDEAHKHIYIGTFQMSDGALVFHLFEVKDDPNEGETIIINKGGRP